MGRPYSLIPRLGGPAGQLCLLARGRGYGRQTMQADRTGKEREVPQDPNPQGGQSVPGKHPRRASGSGRPVCSDLQHQASAPGAAGVNYPAAVMGPCVRCRSSSAETSTESSRAPAATASSRALACSRRCSDKPRGNITASRHDHSGARQYP